MRKLFGGAVALVLVATMVTACGGYSEEEATARCEQEAVVYGGGACFDSSTQQGCIDAHMECGDDALADEGCPLKYSCPED